MQPINKIRGNVCSICGEIITSEPGQHLMCPKCQKNILDILSKLKYFIK